MITNNRDLSSYFSPEIEHQLLLIVHLSTIELGKIARQIISEYQFPFVSIGNEITSILINEPKANYSKRIVHWFPKRVKELSKEPVLIMDIDLLFEPSLELDPLVLFRQTSKNSSLIVIWPGDFKKNSLSYASPEHTHYRTWSNPGVEIIRV